MNVRRSATESLRKQLEVRPYYAIKKASPASPPWCSDRAMKHSTFWPMEENGLVERGGSSENANDGPGGGVYD
jgi:hypothetical protein